jgi:hypothetical protein
MFEIEAAALAWQSGPLLFVWNRISLGCDPAVLEATSPDAQIQNFEKGVME